MISSESPWFCPPPAFTGRRIAVVGAGLAGCAAAAHLATAGYEIALFDRASDIAQKTSGNPAGLVNPRLTGEPTLDTFYRAAADYFFTYVERLVAEHPTLSLRCRFDGIDGVEAAYRRGGWLAPGDFCRAQLSANDRVQLHFNCDITSLRPSDTTWQLFTADHRLFEADAVVLARGFIDEPDSTEECASLRPQAGQITLISNRLATSRLERPFSKKRHYGIPLNDEQTLCGAANYRTVAQPPEHERDLANLAGLAEHLGASQIDPSAIVSSRTGTRATTPDHLPVVGAIPDQAYFESAYASLHHGRRGEVFPPARYIFGLYLINGLGSHGILASPLLGKLLHDVVAGKVKDEQQNVLQLLHPARFILRQMSRKPTDRKA